MDIIQTMIDNFGRNITYLRISITDMCNLRCRYCMPDEQNHQCTCSKNMSLDEISMAIKTAADLGINKVRITGGEPLVRKDAVEICSMAARTDGIREVCMTTNGILLPKYAKELRNAGVKRLNISMDTLDEKKYGYITRRGKLGDVILGIEKALDEGFEKIKLNSVLIGGFNDDEIENLANLTYRWPIDVRFIEMMPMYDGGDFSDTAFIPYTTVLEKLPQLEKKESNDGVSKLYKLPDAKGYIGLISPVSDHFCARCNRIRITSDGKIKPCLHSNQEYSIKGLNCDEMMEVFKVAISTKPEKHKTLSYNLRSEALRNMNEIGG